MSSAELVKKSAGRYNKAMEKMTPVYSPEDLRRLEKKRRNTTLFCWLLGLAALGTCVALCALTRTANAERMELACIVIWTAAGWLILYLRRFVVTEAGYERQHAEMLRQGEAETICGRVTVTGERLRIIRSIRITSVLVENESGTRRLKLCTSRENKLKAAGDRLTLHVVNGYIAGYSPAEPGE